MKQESNGRDWNNAAAEVIRGLDEAPASLRAKPGNEGGRWSSDHGFGPCLGRIHVNRIGTGPASPDYRAGPGSSAAARSRPATGSVSQKRITPKARSSSFDQSVTAQYPLIEAHLAFAPTRHAMAHGLRPTCGPPWRCQNGGAQDDSGRSTMPDWRRSGLSKQPGTPRPASGSSQRSLNA